jgi:hypothetical protein
LAVFCKYLSGGRDDQPTDICRKLPLLAFEFIEKSIPDLGACVGREAAVTKEEMNAGRESGINCTWAIRGL